MTSVLVVDAANVVGSVPDGWWKDRAAAARKLHERLLVGDTTYDVIVLVLEGGAKGGVRAGRDAHVHTVHAARDGDSEIRRQVTTRRERGDVVTVVTADRALGANVSPALGAEPLLVARPDLIEPRLGNENGLRGRRWPDLVPQRRAHRLPSRPGRRGADS